MTVNELRLGNWILNKLPVDGFVTPFPLQVTFSTFQSLHQAQIEERPLFLEPIPLTPEILEKCGFEKKNYKTLEGMPIWSDGKFRVRVYDWDNTIHVEDYFFNQFVEIKYLHQLQNLYFALTGEELAVNLIENVEQRTEP